MEEKRKPRPWLMWPAVALGLVVAYPLSLGPTTWLFEYFGFPYNGSVGGYLRFFYRPLLTIMDHRVEPGCSWLEWYLDFWQ